MVLAINRSVDAARDAGGAAGSKPKGWWWCLWMLRAMVMVQHVLNPLAGSGCWQSTVLWILRVMLVVPLAMVLVVPGVESLWAGCGFQWCCGCCG